MKYFNCAQCGVLTPNKWRRKTARYCSVYCRTRILVKQYPVDRPEVKRFSGKTKLIDNKYLVNEEYYDWLNQYKWHTSDTGYAVRRNTEDGYKKTTRMHRLVIDAPDGEIVDHIDRNKLNNTISNLRITTQQTNVRNSDRYDNARRYCYDKNRKKWLVRIGGKNYGRYKTEQEAIDKVKEIYYGRQ